MSNADGLLAKGGGAGSQMRYVALIKLKRSPPFIHIFTDSEKDHAGAGNPASRSLSTPNPSCVLHTLVTQYITLPFHILSYLSTGSIFEYVTVVMVCCEGIAKQSHLRVQVVRGVLLRISKRPESSISFAEIACSAP